MKNFNATIKKHLSNYKYDNYEDEDNGIWKRTGTVLEYAFQNNDDKYFNILGSYRKQFIDYLTKHPKLKLHMYFHHMNSSQAMCINFFYPLLVEKQLEQVLHALGFKDEKVNYETVQFEKSSIIESSKGFRPTSFDFYFKTISGKEYFFEIKYTENGFGKATSDKAHINKFHNVYKEHLEAINEQYRDMDKFFENYQIIRNLIHIGDNKYVVFVYPEDNTKVKVGAELARNEILSNYSKNLILMDWHRLVESIHCTNPKIKENMKEFSEKYLKYK